MANKDEGGGIKRNKRAAVTCGTGGAGRRTSRAGLGGDLSRPPLPPTPTPALASAHATRVEMKLRLWLGFACGIIFDQSIDHVIHEDPRMYGCYVLRGAGSPPGHDPSFGNQTAPTRREVRFTMLEKDKSCLIR